MAAGNEGARLTLLVAQRQRLHGNDFVATAVQSGNDVQQSLYNWDSLCV